MKATSHAQDYPLAGKHREFIQAACHQVAEMRSRSRTRPEPADDDAVPILPPDALTGYEIIREVHRGAQGVVYQALQKSTRRMVAIKVMKEGPFAGPADRSRFEREIQILGQLDHPNVVTIHDSGIASGCHYFVMDYVEGKPLDRWVSDFGFRISDSGPKAALEVVLGLFVKICEAVNAAHLKGIIHRDLKPGNVLVVEGESDRKFSRDSKRSAIAGTSTALLFESRLNVAEPRILDFGLARMTEEPGTIRNPKSEIRNLTTTGQFIGSLPWASPEQAEGRTDLIDMRTDVYALGVILFQMLTERFPYDVFGSAREVLDRIVRAAPARPSAVAQRRQPPLRINDELDTMVLQCLAKERERRYQSAGELARDVRRYLAGEPIEAKRDSVTYVLRKHLRRYRLPLAVAATFIIVVTSGFLVSLGLWRSAERNRADAEVNLVRAREAEASASLQARRAESEAERARMESMTANRVKEFVIDVFTVADPEEGGGESATARELLDAGAAEAAEELSDEPQVYASMLETLGSAYGGLGLFERADALLGQSVDLRRDAGESGPELAGGIEKLAEAHLALGRKPEAESLLREALELRRASQPDSHPDVATCLVALGETLRLQGQLDAAQPLLEEGLRILRLHGDGQPELLADALNSMALLLNTRADYDRAEAMSREAVSLMCEAKGNRSAAYAVVLNNLAVILKNRQDLDAAEALYREGLEVRRQVYGDDHPKIAVALNNLANVLRNGGKPEEAEPLYRQALNIRRRRLGPDHALTANTLDNLGNVLDDMGRADEARPIYHESLAMRRRTLGSNHPETARGINNLALFLRKQGEPIAAEALFREGMEIQRRALGPDHPDFANTATNLGYTLAEVGRLDEAEPLCRQAVEVMRGRSAMFPARVAATLCNLADVLVRTGRPEEAEPLLREALSLEAALRPEDGGPRASTLGMLGACLVSQSRFAEAEPLLKESYGRTLAAHGQSHPQTVRAVERLVDLYERWGKPEQAARWHSASQPASEQPTDD